MARLAAGTRKRSDGTLEKRFTLEGKRYSVYGKTTQELIEKEAEIRAGAYKANDRITLDQYFEEWIRRKAKTVKGGTINNHKRAYRLYISPVLGGSKIVKIERRQILALQESIAEGRKASTVNTIIILVHSILKDAERDGIIDRNPAQYIKGIRDESPKASENIHRALTVEEQAAFMEAAKGDYYYELFAFLLCTGIRIGEAAALTWADIDRKANVIHVTKTATRDAEGKIMIGTPKTKTSVRDIPLTETTRTLLKQQREKQGTVIIPAPTCRIFQSPTGKIILSNNLRNSIARIEKAAGIEHIGVHALRDTFATRFIEQGGNPQTLKTILGHSSLAMTMDLYAHVLPNTKQEEMDRLRIIV